MSKSQTRKCVRHRSVAQSQSLEVIWNTPASELKGNALLVCGELRAVETIPSSSQH